MGQQSCLKGMQTLKYFTVKLLLVHTFSLVPWVLHCLFVSVKSQKIGGKIVNNGSGNICWASFFASALWWCHHSQQLQSSLCWEHPWTSLGHLSLIYLVPEKWEFTTSKFLLKGNLEFKPFRVLIKLRGSTVVYIQQLWWNTWLYSPTTIWKNLPMWSSSLLTSVLSKVW